MKFPGRLLTSFDVHTLEEYQERNFRFLGKWTIAEQTLKVYVIHRQNECPPGDDLVESARNYVSSLLPDLVNSEGGAHGPGFVIIHVGAVATWLLTHWWAHQDICLSTIASAKIGADNFERLDHRQFHACVWEQKVISHESEAWIRVLKSRQSDVGGYYTDVLPDGRY